MYTYMHAALLRLPLILDIASLILFFVIAIWLFKVSNVKVFLSNAPIVSLVIFCIIGIIDSIYEAAMGIAFNDKMPWGVPQKDFELVVALVVLLYSLFTSRGKIFSAIGTFVASLLLGYLLYFVILAVISLVVFFAIIIGVIAIVVVLVVFLGLGYWL